MYCTFMYMEPINSRLKSSSAHQSVHAIVKLQRLIIIELAKSWISWSKTLLATQCFMPVASNHQDYTVSIHVCTVGIYAGQYKHCNHYTVYTYEASLFAYKFTYMYSCTIQKLSSRIVTGFPKQIKLDIFSLIINCLTTS